MTVTDDDRADDEIYGQAYQDHRTLSQWLGEDGFRPVMVVGAVVLALAVAGLVFADDLSRGSVALRGPEDGATPDVMRLLAVPLIVAVVLAMATLVRERYRDYMWPGTYQVLVYVSVFAYNAGVVACLIALAFFQDDLVAATRAPVTGQLGLVRAAVVALAQAFQEWRMLLRYTAGQAD